eukprot:g1954.t1
MMRKSIQNISTKKKRKSKSKKKKGVVRGQTFLSFGKAGLALTKRRKISEKTSDVAIDQKKKTESDIVKDSQHIVESIGTQVNKVDEIKETERKNEEDIIKDSKNIVESIGTQVHEVDEVDKETDKETKNKETETIIEKDQVDETDKETKKNNNEETIIEKDQENTSTNLNNNLSEYERKRLENMKRNRQILIELGLEKPLLSEKPKPRRRGNTKRKRKIEIPPRRATRRSRRLQKQVATSIAEEESSEEEEEEELPFDDSKVATYSSISSTSIISRPDFVETKRKAETMTLSRLTEITSEPLEDSYLSRVYSMSFSKDASMLVAAGHGGRVSVFSALAQSEDDDVLMSFKAHSGWISTA